MAWQFAPFAGFCPPCRVVGYSAKEQKNTKPTGIITFQWDSVNGETMKLNGFIVPSNPGTAFDHGNLEDCTPGWYLTAPKIQIRRPDGGYTVRYYADDGWDNENNGTRAGWCIEDGSLDTTTELTLGGGAWISCADGDCSFTTSGAVASSETAVGGDSTITMLCGGAFPVSFAINDTDAVTWTLTPGTAFNHGTAENYTVGWHLTAPKIQIRRPDGGYTVRYYADDGWDNENNDTRAGWCIEDGSLDTTTTVDVGGGFWLNQPNGDQKIYVTVKNPVK